MATTPPASQEIAEPPKKRRRCEPNFAHPEALVTFLVGPGDDPKKFVIHKEFAVSHSPILNAAFNGNFIEGQTQTYCLEDTSPGAFRLFTQWIYQQELDLFQSKDLEKQKEDVRWDLKQRRHDEDKELAELWVLANKMGMPRLQDLVVSKIIEIRREFGVVAVRTLPYIYDRTAVDSALRRLMVSEVAMCAHKVVFKEADFLPHEFLIDLAVHMTAFRPENKNYVGNASDSFASSQKKE